MAPRLKKRKLSRTLANATLSYCCGGDLKTYMENCTPSEREAIDGYSFYVEGLGDDLGNLLEEYILERLDRGPLCV